MIGVGAHDPFGNRGFVPSGTPVPMVIDQIKNTDYSRRGAPWRTCDKAGAPSFLYQPQVYLLSIDF